MKLCRVKSYDRAVNNNYYIDYYGGFYAFNFGGKLYTQHGQYLIVINGQDTYENRISDYEYIPYMIEEIEAFRVIKQ